VKKLQSSVGKGGRNLRSDVLSVQRLLTLKGFSCSENIDGRAGKRTEEAIRDFQKSIGQAQTGLITFGSATWNRLVNAQGAQRILNLAKWEGNPYAWSQQKKLESMHPDLRTKVEAVMYSLRRLGYKPTITNAWRSVCEQARLVQQKRSKVLFSFHNVQHPDGTPNAHAADIVDENHQYDLARKETLLFFDALGKEAKKVGLYWGGDWTNFIDRPHVQLLPDTMLSSMKKASGL
jgi:hypothetical protein